MHTSSPTPSDAAPTDTLIVGAGPAGLAVAACLAQRGRRALVLERAGQVGSSWREHYERLHLHTVKSHSALPGLPFSDEDPRYVPRQGVVDYLDRYARYFGIEPVFGQGVRAIEPVGGPGPARWAVCLDDGSVHQARHVVLATGANRVPRVPKLPGEAQFGGRVLHSHRYRRAEPFKGQRVLVVGMGNTGAEIALDLAEQGVAVALSVRSPVNIVKRDVLGRPTQVSSILLGRLPPVLGNAIARWMRDLTVGDLSRWGIRTAQASPLAQLREDGKTPVIDLGTLALVRSGKIRVHPGIETLLPGRVRFTDGSEAPFDTVLLATGFDAALPSLFSHTALGLDARGMPAEAVGQGTLAGLYFVGFDVRQPGGLLRTIAQQAVRVADALVRDDPA